MRNTFATNRELPSSSMEIIGRHPKRPCRNRPQRPPTISDRVTPGLRPRPMNAHGWQTKLAPHAVLGRPPTSETSALFNHAGSGAGEHAHGVPETRKLGFAEECRRQS